ncbi:MAG: hypothetical protein U9R74_18030 [Pseudomonadota bacterium]|nr:hypothetical protein [Pseudomonadota bacterium]
MPKKTDTHGNTPETDGVTRREFLAYSAAGALAGLAPFTSAWGEAQPADGRHPHHRRKRRTLFFNLSHEPDSDTARYILVAGGRRYHLHKVKEGSPILRRARRRNRFLQQVPDSALTHVARNVLTAGGVQLHYVIKDADTATGTWSMSSMFFQLPASAIVNAFERGVVRLGSEPRRPSAKRKLYGLEAAVTPWDLLEEAALCDSSDHATAIIGVNPELLSAEPNSAADIQCNHIATNINTFILAQKLSTVGAATPQQHPNLPNDKGWATMTPVLDDNGQPFKNQKGNNKGLIQYHPAWNESIVPDARAGMIGSKGGPPGVMNPIKNDPKLGADITGLDPNVKHPNVSGAVWQRQDGFTTVDQGPTADGAVQDALKYTLSTQHFRSGFKVTGSAKAQSDGSGVQATLTFTNSFVRWLGIYLLFMEGKQPVDAPSDLEFTLPDDYKTDDESRAKLASEKAVFAFLLGPEFTLLGVPISADTATMTFNIPETATGLRIFASGPSFHRVRPPDPNDPSTWGDPLPGVLSTVLFNYGLTVMLMVAGAAPAIPAVLKAALPIAAAVVVALVTDLINNLDFSKPDAWRALGLAILKAFLNVFANPARIPGLFVALTAAMAEGEAEDAIPIAGQVAMGISLAAGAATLLETTIEIAESPVSYVYDLVLTHDLSVTILPDKGNSNFPSQAKKYKVTALFENGGTPHVQIHEDFNPDVDEVKVTFKNVPEGGKVNVSAGFYSSSSEPDENDWLAGKGSSGLVPNTVGANVEFHIEQSKVPIRSNTVYEHKRKITLDAHDDHQWTETPVGPTTKQSDISCESSRGHLCEFQGITVRQGTSEPPVLGYVGYAWQGYSRDVLGCSGGHGQFDQLANLGVLKAQQGYVTAPCGFPTGVQLTYSLLSRGGANFYLDSKNQLIRQIRLDPPGFDDPTNMQAWGALNLPSKALLLHPSGRIVSINNVNSKIEVLKIPDAAMTDDEAKATLLADVYSGPGSRPGLIDAPCAAAVSPEGVLLILEDNNSRLQAFDLGGNPLQFFKKQRTPYFLNLEATAGGDTMYLDLAVEFTGYLYVLSFNIGTNLYRLDIYHPDQTDTDPISTTFNVNAAKLTVDFWRNVYTLNYELLKLPDGSVPSITEPSVSQWVPSTP